MARRGFISFLNDDDSKVDTYCEILEETQSYVKIALGKSIITLPYSRILKLKMLKEEVEK